MGTAEFSPGPFIHASLSNNILIACFVKAQYYRDPNNIPTYMASSHFLASINNEYPPSNASSRNATYAHNLASLHSLVLVLFSDDKTVVPKESAWFGSEAPTEDLSSSAMDSAQSPISLSLPEKLIIPIRAHPMYTEDWIGLRKLDKKGAIVFEVCEGEHMHIGDCWKKLVKRHCGGFGKIEATQS
jgi:palmitoyl-protein thioesterase